MDIKVRSSVVMSIVKDEREFVLMVPFGVPYEDAKAIVSEFIAGLDELQKANQKAAEELQRANAPIDIESEPKGE